MKKSSTSWQSDHRSYDRLVGDEGQHYHKEIILPKTLELLQLAKESTLLDLGCGQGVLARALPEGVDYVGIDLSQGLIKAARERSKHTFIVGDITKPYPPLPRKMLFSHAACILAIQNVEHPDKVFSTLAPHLMQGARFVIVMNHPAFRIPRQTSWTEDEATKLQCRKINVYMTPQKIPIDMHPAKTGDKKTETWSFHFPLSHYVQWLFQAGFVIEQIEEWCSDKVSVGAKAKAENRARKEIPLFMAIVARKI